MAVGPFGQCHMQCLVIIITVVKNRDDALRLPDCSLVRALRRQASVKNVSPTDSLAKNSISREGIHHVPNYRILDAISDKQNGESPEYLTDEPAGPAFGQVGRAEIRACKNERMAIGVSIVDQPM